MSDRVEAAVLTEAEQARPSGLASGRTYLFALVHAHDVQEYGCAGLDGKGVTTVCEGRLAAIVGGIPGPKVRPERRNLAAHQDVLKELLASATPLPMAFGLVAESPQQIRKILRRNQRAFLDDLRHVAGKVEMGLRVRWDVPNIFEYFVTTHEELRAARDRILGGNRPPTQEEKIELGRKFDRLLSEDRENHTAQIQRLLSSCCEVKVGKCLAEHEVMNLACLVERQAQDTFGAAVFQAAQMFDNNFAFDYNGPWAPHNFVSATVDL